MKRMRTWVANGARCKCSRCAVWPAAARFIGSICVRRNKHFWKRMKAFGYFGGVFRKLRYDNLASAVKKILRGHRREETARFIAFRSHWGFASEFCTPGAGNEKGGVG